MQRAGEGGEGGRREGGADDRLGDREEDEGPGRAEVDGQRVRGGARAGEEADAGLEVAEAAGGDGGPLVRRLVKALYFEPGVCAARGQALESVSVDVHDLAELNHAGRAVHHIWLQQTSAAVEK